MALWYLGMSVLLVAYVFRSQGIDYRLIALGSLLPVTISIVTGGRSYGSALLAAVVALAVVMIATIGRPRLVRRRLLCLPIGYLAGLVLSGAWLDADRFWWPLGGWTVPTGPILPAWWVVLLLEGIGLVACWWVVGMCDLYEPAPRREFWRTGRLRTPA